MSIIINILHASYAFEGLGYHCDEEVLENDHLDDSLDYPHDPDEVNQDLVIDTWFVICIQIAVIVGLHEVSHRVLKREYKKARSP